MTDEQIIKALEHNASKCKFYEDGHDGGLFESTLDLINRQNEEIEELKNRNAFLENEYKNQGELFWERMKIKQSETIKEFAERLKGYAIGENGSKEKAYFFVEVQDIDNLVKEMTEVEE